MKKPILLTIAVLLTALGLHALNRSLSMSASADRTLQHGERQAREALAMIPPGETDVPDDKRDEFSQKLIDAKLAPESAASARKAANDARLITAGCLLAAAAAAALAFRKKKDPSPEIAR